MTTKFQIFSVLPSAPLQPSSSSILKKPLATTLFGTRPVDTLKFRVIRIAKPARGGGAIRAGMNLFDRFARVVTKFMKDPEQALEEWDRKVQLAFQKYDEDLVRGVLARLKAAEQAVEEWDRKVELALQKGEENLDRKLQLVLQKVEEDHARGVLALKAAQQALEEGDRKLQLLLQKVRGGLAFKAAEQALEEGDPKVVQLALQKDEEDLAREVLEITLDVITRLRDTFLAGGYSLAAFFVFIFASFLLLVIRKIS